MNKGILIGAMLLLPQLAMAEVYMCVDPATGKTSFTDKACERQTSGEEIKVEAANLESGRRYVKAQKRKIWHSQTDTRKTGLDYNAERRALYKASATASAD